MSRRLQRILTAELHAFLRTKHEIYCIKQNKKLIATCSKLLAILKCYGGTRKETFNNFHKVCTQNETNLLLEAKIQRKNKCFSSLKVIIPHNM